MRAGLFTPKKSARTSLAAEFLCQYYTFFLSNRGIWGRDRIVFFFFCSISTIKNSTLTNIVNTIRIVSKNSNFCLGRIYFFITIGGVIYVLIIKGTPVSSFIDTWWWYILFVHLNTSVRDREGKHAYAILTYAYKLFAICYSK